MVRRSDATETNSRSRAGIKPLLELVYVEFVAFFPCFVGLFSVFSGLPLLSQEPTFPKLDVHIYPRVFRINKCTFLHILVP